MIVLCATPGCPGKIKGVPAPGNKPTGPWYCDKCKEGKK